MNTQHTPGPWHLRGDTVLVSPRLQICQLDRGNKHPATSMANAYLIAAAPEMLAALYDIADAAYGTDTPKLRERARAALAKATQP